MWTLFNSEKFNKITFAKKHKGCFITKCGTIKCGKKTAGENNVLYT